MIGYELSFTVPRIKLAGSSDTLEISEIDKIAQSLERAESQPLWLSLVKSSQLVGEKSPNIIKYNQTIKLEDKNLSTDEFDFETTLENINPNNLNVDRRLFFTALGNMLARETAIYTDIKLLRDGVGNKVSILSFMDMKPSKEDKRGISAISFSPFQHVVVSGRIIEEQFMSDIHLKNKMQRAVTKILGENMKIMEWQYRLQDLSDYKLRMPK